MSLLGCAGSGKAVTHRALRAALEEQGLRCQAMCLTHTGTRNMGGEGAMTADLFAMRHVLHDTFAGQVLLIEEISFMPMDLLGALEDLRLKGVRINCFGDFGQRPPVCERWRGCKVAPDVFERSLFFWPWSQGMRFVLRRCRRSDQAHFDFSLRPQGMERGRALGQPVPATLTQKKRVTGTSR